MEADAVYIVQVHWRVDQLIQYPFPPHYEVAISTSMAVAARSVAHPTESAEAWVDARSRKTCRAGEPFPSAENGCTRDMSGI